ncbi:unnamed protein product, partial [Oppiella nova]
SMAVYYNGLPAPQQSIVYQVPPPAEGLPQRQMLHPGQMIAPGQVSNYSVPMQGPNGHMYAFPGSGYQSSQHQGMTSAYDSPVGTFYAQQGLQPPSYSEFEPGGSGQQLDPEPPMVGYIAPHKTMPNLYRNLQRGMYAGCGVALVSAVIVFALLMIALNSLTSIYTESSISTLRSIFISFGVLTIILELLGIGAAIKEVYWLCIIYAVLSGGLAGLCLYAGIRGFGGLLWYLMVVFFVSGCFGSYFAKDMKRLEKLARSTTVYVSGMPGQPNYGYQIPPSGQVPNYGPPNGQMYMTGPTGPYQQSQHQPMGTGYHSSVGNSYGQSTQQPPSYGQSSTGAGQPNLHVLGAHDPNYPPGAVLELLGIWGANKEIYWLCIIYSFSRQYWPAYAYGEGYMEAGVSSTSY